MAASADFPSQNGGDVAIIGAGIIGLSIAFELAGMGASARVYEKDRAAGSASWAAAGMLAPFTERLADEALRSFGERSLALYPAFVETVRHAGGIDPHLRLDGIVHAAFNDEQCEGLRELQRAIRTAGGRARVLDRNDALLAEPALGKHVQGALLVDAEGHVDNRRLGRALVAGCIKRGVRIENQKCLAVDFDARRVLGLRTTQGYVATHVVVNAAGMSAGELSGVPEECAAPLHPRKGQMCALTIPAGLVRRPLWVPGAYLVPRSDGRLLVGATSEARNDTIVTAGAIQMLLEAALLAAPALRDFALTETWAGVRPATSDGRPYIGATPREGYYVAAGHYRNGILLAPLTARLVAQAIARGSHHVPQEFSLARFGTKAATA